MVSCLLSAVGIEPERAHTVQRADETNVGHSIGKQSFPLPKKRQQGDRILCGGIYAPRTHGKFNTPAASGSDGVEILTPSPCGMAVFPQIVVFARNNR